MRTTHFTPRRVLLTAAAGLMAAGAVAASTAPALAPAALAGWPAQIGTSALDNVSAVATSASGDVYAAGFTMGVLGSTSSGGQDAFLARYDRYGTLLWVRQFGTTESDVAVGLAVSADGIDVTGNTLGSFDGFVNAGGWDGYVARFGQDGSQRWIRQFGTAGDDLPGGVAAAGSDIYVAGATDGAFPGFSFLGGDGDVFLTRFDRNGNQVWVRQFGTTGSDRGNGVAVSTSGDPYVVGQTDGAFDGPASGWDGFLARYDRNGNQRWIRQFGTAGSDEAFSVALSGNAAYVAGDTTGAFPDFENAGPMDAFVVRIDQDSDLVWASQFGTTENDQAFGVAARGGDVVVVGFTHGAFPGFANLGGYDGFVARYDKDGAQQWVRQFGTPADEVVYGVSLRSSNNYGGAIVVGGPTSGTVWGQVNAGGQDGFVAAFPL